MFIKSYLILTLLYFTIHSKDNYFTQNYFFFHTYKNEYTGSQFKMFFLHVASENIQESLTAI